MNSSDVVSLSSSELLEYSGKLQTINEGITKVIKSYNSSLERLTDSSVFDGAIIAPIKEESETAIKAQKALSSTLEQYITFINSNVTDTEALDNQIASDIGGVEAIDFSAMAGVSAAATAAGAMQAAYDGQANSVNPDPLYSDPQPSNPVTPKDIMEELSEKGYNISTTTLKDGSKIEIATAPQENVSREKIEEAHSRYATKAIEESTAPVIEERGAPGTLLEKLDEHDGFGFQTVQSGRQWGTAETNRDFSATVQD